APAERRRQLGLVRAIDAVSGSWYLSAYAGGPAGRADDGQDAARYLDPVGKAAQTAGISQRGTAMAVVTHAHRKQAGRHVHAHRCRPGLGMLRHVGQTLRAEEVNKRSQPGREILDGAVHLDLYRDRHARGDLAD